MMRRVAAFLCPLGFAVPVGACGRITRDVRVVAADRLTNVNELWQEPDYRGIYRDAIDTVTRADVRWVCGLMNRLTDEQWRDAFRAGGNNPEQTSRYGAKIKAKIAQGLQMTSG